MANGTIGADQIALVHSLMLGMSGQAPLDSTQAALVSAIHARDGRTLSRC
jgi:hypothetical protein